MGAKENSQDTTFQESIMKRMLPPIKKDGKTYVPGINEYFDANRGGKPHGGIDFNYHQENGGRVGQTGVNLEKQAVRAPVSGTVTNTDSKWGMVEITARYIQKLLMGNFEGVSY